MKKQKAFTLAEVLITLAIIGVIAAITIPTLVMNGRKSSYSTAVRKFYSNLTDAVEKYMVEGEYVNMRRSPMEQDDYEAAQQAANQFIRDNFAVVKECKNFNNDGCFADTYKSIDGNSSIEGRALGRDSMVLKDGSTVSIGSLGDYPLEVHFDVNGKKGPNIAGYDLWTMYIYYNGVVEEFRDGVIGKRHEEDICSSNAYAGSCFSKLINNKWVIDW